MYLAARVWSRECVQAEEIWLEGSRPGYRLSAELTLVTPSSSVLHHESAYDAAAPSRNKSSTAAPMRAFDANPGGTPTGAGGSSYPPSAPSSGAGAPKLSPLPQSSLREVNSVTFEDKTPTATNGVGQPDDLGYFGE